MNNTGKKVWREIKSLFIIIIIALTLRATVVEAYIVPTGSMENTIMTGDFLIGNKFIYGMRTPDWLGIPYTDWGVFIPWIRFPEFRQPKKGDVVIFKYPRDVYQKYVKRLIGRPGQTVEISKKKVFIDGKEFILPVNGKYLFKTLNPVSKQAEIFLKDGNRDNLGPIYIPKEGDTLYIHTNANWDYILPIMMLDGHKISLKSSDSDAVFLVQNLLIGKWEKIKIDGEFTFTNFDPIDVERRKKTDGRIIGKYKNKKLINPWRVHLPENAIDYLYFDDTPFSEIQSYVVEQDYYWMMGDNRDDSADSRYWGFVPDDYILGEALFAYMSWDFNDHKIRYWRIGKVIN